MHNEGIEGSQLMDSGGKYDANIGLKITIVHDYLTQKGGAERVLLSMLNAFPNAKVVTLFYEPRWTFPEFQEYKIDVSSLNRITMFRHDPRLALPLLARFTSQLDLGDPDVVLCSSSGWAHGVSTNAPKVVYCYNPARWLYQPADYTRQLALRAQISLRLQRKNLLRWDRAAAVSAHRYLTTSTSVAERIVNAYGITPTIVPPPMSLDVDGPQEPVRSIAPGYFLAIGRNRGYKNLDVACEAFMRLPNQHLVIVGLPPSRINIERATNIQVIKNCTDNQLRWLYANSRSPRCRTRRFRADSIGRERIRQTGPSPQRRGLS